MMFALLALQSALACGPYGGYAESDDGAWAYEDEDSIVLFTADGDRAELPVYGEVTAMDFVGEELVVAYFDTEGSLAILFDEDGDEAAEWSPLFGKRIISDIVVLRQGLILSMNLDGSQSRVRLTDDLEPTEKLDVPHGLLWR